MTQLVGAIDQGTTGTRFILFDHAGATVAAAHKEHRQIYPRPGWVEHDPLEIWRNTLEVAALALDRAREGGARIELAAIGIANQRETTLVWDRRTGAPLGNAIVWQDTRVGELVAAYARAGGRDRFRAKTGLPLASYFSALKLRWLLDNSPDARKRAEAGELLFGTVDSWLIWNLTGGPAVGRHITDVSNASRTQLMDLRRLAWDAELLDAFAVPDAMLPRIVSSSAVYGEAAVEPLRGVKIAAALGDQQAALLGQACIEPGEVKNTYGTGCFVLMNTGHKLVASTAGLISTVAFRLGEGEARYALEGSVAVAGALVQWLRDNLGIIATSAEIETLAASVPDNGDVYLVPAFSGLYAPHWNEGARGTIVGLTRFATKAHLARAALEATAYQTRDVLEAMEKDSGIPVRALRVDGGMSVNALLMQFQADILNAQVVRSAVAETTALGAAYAAGLATGYWTGMDELARNWRASATWAPRMASDERARLIANWKRAVTRSLDWLG